MCSLRGLESRWSGYLQSLPQSAVDIALLWADDQLPQGLDQGRKEDLNIEDVRHARAWAAGTELSRELRGDGVDGVLVSLQSLIPRPIYDFLYNHNSYIVTLSACATDLPASYACAVVAAFDFQFTVVLSAAEEF